MWCKGYTLPFQPKIQQIILDDDDVNTETGFTLLHEIILGLKYANLAEQLQLDDSLIYIADSAGWTPLHWATWQGDPEAVKTLLYHGAQPQLGTVFDETSLHLAAHTGSYDCARLLLETGASVAAVNLDGRTPLHGVAQSRQHGSILVELLVSSKAQMDTVDNNGDNALHRAVRLKNAQVVGALITHGAEINARGISGRTALHDAAADDYEQIAKILITSGADIESRDNNSYTPVMLGTCKSAVNVVRLLLAKGARLDHVDRQGKNILHIAAGWGNWQILKLLTQAKIRGVDPEATDKLGRTPMDLFIHYRPGAVDGPCERLSHEKEMEIFKKLLASARYNQIENVLGSGSEGANDADSSHEEFVDAEATPATT